MSKNIVLDDIFAIEDYLDELEEKVPEVHSGTLRIEELSDINTRAAQLVPEYQPTTSGISLSNLISIKENTIAKEPTPEPEPEEEIVVKFFYADPFCIAIKKDFDINDEYWTQLEDTGSEYSAWNPKSDDISYTFMGHKFTGTDVWVYLGEGANHFEIEVDPDAIEREHIEQTTTKVPIVLTFNKGAFISGTTPSKAVNYSFTFTDELNGGDYPYKEAIIDTSDPTVTHTTSTYDGDGGKQYALDIYSLPSNSLFNDEYWETIGKLIINDIFTTINLIDNEGHIKTYTIDDMEGSISNYFNLYDSDNNFSGEIESVETLESGDMKGFVTKIIGAELLPK